MYTFVVAASLSSTYPQVRPVTCLRVGLLAAARGTRPKAGSSNLNTNRCDMARCLLLLIATLSLISGAFAAEKEIDALLPAECTSGWAMDGKVATYNPENLYKYIDGEAELYMPYGFRKAATVMYARPGSSDTGMVVNIFEMGSLLDAYGIYSNYLTPALEQAKIGADGFVDESQLMFYQDRYFVQIEASGTVTQGGPLFRSCGEAISRNLPAGKQRPRELDFLKIPEAVPLTEKYYASGLLGHDFFGKGFTCRGDDRQGACKVDSHTS